MKKYSMFIGRWQPWHEGHRWLIDQRLKKGKNVWIAIRDVEPNKDQPWTAEEVFNNLKNELSDLLNEAIATLGENIVIARFIRFAVGENSSSS